MAVFQLLAADGALAPIRVGDDPVSIGRHPENTLVLQDQLLSRYHCVIEASPSGGYRIRDLKSRNGTFLNGERVDEASLKAGDELRVGSVRFHLAPLEARPDRRRSKDRAERSERAEVVQSEWARTLSDLISNLPPKDAEFETIELIDSRGEESRALEKSSEGPLATRLLLLLASKSRATDIHVEPKGEGHSIRMRVDGQMLTLLDLPNAVGEAVLGLIKAACQFQPSSREKVLDGHFSTRFLKGAGRRVDYRVSLTPSVHGPKLVVRILDQRDAPSTLRSVGLPPYMHERIRKVVEQDSGMLLCCGPTGSGKTTTIYNALREIDRESKNVITIEDPVEYHIEKVTQIPVGTGQDNTFNTLLRSVLRQDPDVIFVGEIRDEETARTAMRASMTGHLVFSTVHAKDTVASVFRLLDLNVEPYLVANSVEVVLAQRLVRLLCDRCKREVPISPGQATRMGKYAEGNNKMHVATGCAACLRTGYRGRQAIFELLDFTDALRDVILTEPTISKMRDVIAQGMFTTLTQSGWQLVARGITTLEEIDRVATAR